MRSTLQAHSASTVSYAAPNNVTKRALFDALLLHRLRPPGARQKHTGGLVSARLGLPFGRVRCPADPLDRQSSFVSPERRPMPRAPRRSRHRPRPPRSRDVCGRSAVGRCDRDRSDGAPCLGARHRPPQADRVPSSQACRFDLDRLVWLVHGDAEGGDRLPGGGETAIGNPAMGSPEAIATPDQGMA
jgi:hypothetical protein